MNVLQALILTDPDSERMVLTPTYHVFDLYQVHQDATLVPLELHCEPYTCGERSMPSISASASRNHAGVVHLSVCNVNPLQPAEIVCEVRGMDLGSVRGRVLSAAHMTAHNTFDAPNAVRPVEYGDATVDGGRVTVKLPGPSVVVLELSPVTSSA